MKSKKELKEKYRQLKPIMGVFQIKNSLNGKVLIEGSTDINARWNRHQTELKFGSHRNKSLQADWTKFKAGYFLFSILSELEYKDDENINYNQEVKLLQEMVLEELNIPKDKLY